jgi:hypothetical protein
MRRPRRLFLVALVAVPAAAVAAAHGCTSNQPFESVCDWMAYPSNCLREFHNDMQHHQTYPDNIFGDCRMWSTVDPPPTEADPARSRTGTTNGKFLDRSALDTCVLNQGGTVTFSPPVDLTMWPPPLLAEPTTYVLTFTTGDGNMCGSAQYTSQHGFSLTINAPPGTGGAGTGGGLGSSSSSAASSSGAGLPTIKHPACEDTETKVDGGVPVFFGTFSETIVPGGEAFDVACPNGETHHFDLNEVQGIPLSSDPLVDGGTFSACPGITPIVPEASFQVYPGGVGKDGAISFAIVFPPACPPIPAGDTTGITADAVPLQKPDKVVYFNCKIPKGLDTCIDGAKNGTETDVDCGGPQTPPTDMSLVGACPAGCMMGQACLYNCDCQKGQVCLANSMSGMLQCQPSSMGSGVKNCPYSGSELGSNRGQ